MYSLPNQLIGQGLDHVLYLDSVSHNSYGLKVGRDICRKTGVFALRRVKMYWEEEEIQMFTIMFIYQALHFLFSISSALSSITFPFAFCNPATLVFQSATTA